MSHDELMMATAIRVIVQKFNSGESSFCSADIAVLVAYMTKQDKIIQELYSERHEIDQILGKALGYPSLVGIWEGFVATGEHTIVTLALEAADKIKECVK